MVRKVTPARPECLLTLVQYILGSCGGLRMTTMIAKDMGTVVDIRGKTEQRITEVMNVLRNSDVPLSYDDIRLATGAQEGQDGMLRGGTPYDALLYILHTLVEVGYIKRIEEPDGPGRPRMYFRWIGNRTTSSTPARSQVDQISPLESTA